eukprot:5564408-Amphidinium_carterae.1
MISTRTTVSPLALTGDSNASDQRSTASKRTATYLSFFGARRGTAASHYATYDGKTQKNLQ